MANPKFERDAGKFPQRLPRARLARAYREMKKQNEQYKDFVKSAAATELLLQEEGGFLEAEGMEKSYRFKQAEIAANVDRSTASKRFGLRLPELGPYTIDYSRNGRRLLIGGRKGHVALFDWQQGTLDCELFLNETVRDVQYFHNEQYFAVAQKKYTYVYTKSGEEIHRLKEHVENSVLDFLPHHFLLVGGGTGGLLRYHDVSTGELQVTLRTRMGPIQSMAQNPWNAVMHVGHANGTVLLWAPSHEQAVAKLQNSGGPVRAVAVEREGRYMAAAGQDRVIRLWDLRKMAVVDTQYTPTPVAALDVSDRGLLAAAWGPHVLVWRDAFKSHQELMYMTHLFPGLRVELAAFVPLEDVLGVGHRHGVDSLIVPGAGEPNYDALEVNPYESVAQRQQSEVRALLNKLPWDSIAVDPGYIGTVDSAARSVHLTHREAREDRGQKRPRAANVTDERTMRRERNLQRREEKAEQRRLRELGVPDERDGLGAALGRFV